MQGWMQTRPLHTSQSDPVPCRWSGGLSLALLSHHCVLLGSRFCSQLHRLHRIWLEPSVNPRVVLSENPPQCDTTQEAIGHPRGSLDGILTTATAPWIPCASKRWEEKKGGQIEGLKEAIWKRIPSLLCLSPYLLGSSLDTILPNPSNSLQVLLLRFSNRDRW